MFYIEARLGDVTQLNIMFVREQIETKQECAYVQLLMLSGHVTPTRCHSFC